MTKSLMVVGGVSTTQISGNEGALVGGSGTVTVTEANVQLAASQAAVFSNLSANLTTGNTDATVRFRNASANGNQVIVKNGTGLAEDLVNTDSVAAGALFNLAFSDTDSPDPVYTWFKVNVEFASGHGSFHGAAQANPPISDVASSTRYNAFAGAVTGDFVPAETGAQTKNRAYDTFAAMQVRVTANARTNNSVFKNRINGVDGTGIVTFGAGVTGLLQDTTVGDALADGDLLSMSLTLLTGLEDILISLIGCTLTSSTAKCDVYAGNSAGVARAASATASYYVLGGGIAAATTHTEANARVKVGFAGQASNLRIHLSANTYTGSATLKLMKNGAAAVTTTIGAGVSGWIENTTDRVSHAASDELSYEIDEGTSGSITITVMAVTLQDVRSRPVFQNRTQRFYRRAA